MKKDELSRFLKTRVVEALNHDYREMDFETRKVQFLLSESGARVSELNTIDHMDGKIDAYSVDTEAVDMRRIVRIWQLSGPDEDNIRAGKVSTPPGKKIHNDLKGLFDSLLGKQKHLGGDAVTAITDITDEFRKTRKTKAKLTLQVNVLSLYQLTDALKGDIERVATDGIKGLSSKYPGVELEGLTIMGLADFAALESGEAAVPLQQEALKLNLIRPGEVAQNGNTYLAFVEALSIVEYYRKQKAALLHMNARFFLGTSRATANKAIEQSARRADGAKDFHALNNGLVITCKSVSPRELGSAGALMLTSPQVVNGGQTLHTLTLVHESAARSKSSCVADIALCVKVVELGSDATPAGVKPIAEASNTQNALSQRALASYSQIEVRVQKSFAKLNPRWFYERTDGEWRAFRTNMLPKQRKVLTGRSEVGDFEGRVPGKRRMIPRVVRNPQALEAILASMGCLDDSKPKRVFDDKVHPNALCLNLDDAGWVQFSEALAPTATCERFEQTFKENLNTSQPMPAERIFLSWALLISVRALVLSEARAREWVVDYWNDLHGKSLTLETWTTHAQKDRQALTLEWSEHVTNAMQKAVMFQMTRLLAQRYGPLDESRCRDILALPQFAAIAKGDPIEAVLDVYACRTACIGNPATPIYTLFLICREAAAELFRDHKDEIRSMGTKQQRLLGTEWVELLSSNVDKIAAALKSQPEQLLPGVSRKGRNLSDALPPLNHSSKSTPQKRVKRRKAKGRA